MAQDSSGGERTEQATPRKRQEAREKGTVARSQDLTTAVLLLTGAVVAYFTVGLMVTQIGGVSRESFGGLATQRIDLESVVVLGTQCLKFLLYFLLPLGVSILVVGIGVNLVQVGFLVTTKPVSPDVSRLNPMKGFGRIFSRRGIMRFLFGLFKLIVVGSILVYGYMRVIEPESPENLLTLLHYDLPHVVEVFAGAVFSIGVEAGSALLVLALLDFSFQRWQHEQDLRMTKQEVRDELKRMEGDPKLRDRRRRIQQKLALQRMMHDVPKADVVITNPTHVSCAIRYDEAEMSAPRLLAKGEGHVAHRIREKAVEHGVPVVEQPPLARMIYQTTEVGEEVPPDLYQPIAEVLAYVYRLRRKQDGAPV